MTVKVVSTGGYPVEVMTPDDKSGEESVSSENITDATEIGKQILTAKDAEAVKALLGIS